MADGSVTTTGLTELRRAVEAMPNTVRSRSRLLAVRYAEIVRNRARLQLLERTHGTGKSAALIVTGEDPANNEAYIWAQPRGDRPANLPLWLEHGTVKMEGIHYMRDATESIRGPYASDVQRLADVVAQETFG